MLFLGILLAAYAATWCETSLSLATWMGPGSRHEVGTGSWRCWAART